MAPDQNPLRPWKDIARELARETNRLRVRELSEELNRALEEQGLGGRQVPLPEP